MNNKIFKIIIDYTITFKQICLCATEQLIKCLKLHDNYNAIVLTSLTHLTCLCSYNLLRNAPRQSISVCMINLGLNLMSTILYLYKYKAHRINLELCGDIVINHFRQL